MSRISPVFRASRWLHKYLGLLLAPYFIWMCVSGILLNHRKLIEGVSCPLTVMGAEHLYSNWSRGACRGMAFSQRNPDRGYLFGKEAVWETPDGGRSFRPWSNGLPAAAARRDLRTMLLCEGDDREGFALAGGANGLWVAKLSEGIWTRIDLGEQPAGVVKLLRIEDRAIALTDSAAFAASVADVSASPIFAPVDLPRQEAGDDRQRIGGMRFALGIHTGEAWGIVGKLLMDLCGLALVFFSISGIAMWWGPWRVWFRKRRGRPRPKVRVGLLRWLNRNHRSIGIWTAPLSAAITITGLLLCIPLVMMLSGKSVAAWCAPGLRPTGAWQHKIQDALYDRQRDTLVIAADGYWEAPADLSGPFEPVPGGPAGNVMGVNAFEIDAEGAYLVGSFGGLRRWDRATGEVLDHITGKPPKPGRTPAGGFMLSGFFRDPEGREWAAHFYEGVVCLDEDSDRYAMPASVLAGARIPFWLVLHYLHNGRIWSTLSMSKRFLLALLGALFAALVVLTGVYDWTHERRRTKHRRTEG